MLASTVPLDIIVGRSKLVVRGDVVASGAGQLLETVRRRCRHGGDDTLILDLDDVGRIDLVGVRALVAARKCAAAAGVTLVLANASPSITQALRTARVAGDFEYTTLV